MKKWQDFIYETRKLQSPPRKSAAGIKKAIGTLTQSGPHTGGSPYKTVKKTMPGKDDEEDISAPPDAPGGGAIGNPGPAALEEDAELQEATQDTRPKTEPTPFKSKAQKRYKRSRREGDMYSTVGGHTSPKSGKPFNNSTKRAGSDRLRFEEVEPESFETKNRLEPEFWYPDTLELMPHPRERMLEIAEDVMGQLREFTDAKLQDVILTGSLANYNWSRYSDVDLHLVIDFKEIDEDTEIVRGLLDNLRWKWNALHAVKLYGYEVEIYFEDVGHITHARAIYSVMREKWIIKPEPDVVEFDYPTARKKADNIESEYNRLIRMDGGKDFNHVIEASDRLMNKIYRMRKAGLTSTDQEYSAENIAFKILRRENLIDKLKQIKYNALDKKLSLYEEVEDLY